MNESETIVNAYFSKWPHCWPAPTEQQALSNVPRFHDLSKPHSFFCVTFSLMFTICCLFIGNRCMWYCLHATWRFTTTDLVKWESSQGETLVKDICWIQIILLITESLQFDQIKWSQTSPSKKKLLNCSYLCDINSI